MGDGLDVVWKRFFSERTRDLFHRFPGWYRAEVVETNDPLRIHRVRFRCPELHNKDLPAQDKKRALPWAVPAFPMGGKGSGSWFSPSIGDQVWISFEKGHPYGPVWTAAADPTRRKFYTQQSIYGQTPLSVNETGDPADTPSDFNKEYLPKDERPMSFGWRDRYGSFFMLSSVGFFPKEHAEKAAPAGTDPISQSEFKAAQATPEVNQPDVKYGVLATKYGHIMILNDVGYEWKEEFEGDFNKDESQEIARSKYLQKLFNEDKPQGKDQRRIEYRTRYGHKFEMRDVGWAKARGGEYQKVGNLGKTSPDERWVKWRTKGGHLIQMLDKGFDQQSDTFIKRLLKTEVGDKPDKEAELGEDARCIRFETRYGYKMVFDDRDSDKRDADSKEIPRANGIMIKGRRDNRGFGWEFNEKDDLNRLIMYTPRSQVIDMNDREQRLSIVCETAEIIPKEREFRKIDDQSKLDAVTVATPRGSLDHPSPHLILDKKAKVVRLNTGGKQGVEFRDKGGPCKAWAEMRDDDDRGLWFNTDGEYSVWRSKNEKLYIALDETKKAIIIRAEEDTVQIFAEKDVEIIAKKDLKIKADKKIHIKAGTEICMEVAGTKWVVKPGEVGTNKKIKCERLLGFLPKAKPGSGAQTPDPANCQVQEPQQKKVDKKKPDPEPDDRACPAPPQSPPPPAGSSGGGGSAPPPGSPGGPPGIAPPPPPSPSPFEAGVDQVPPDIDVDFGLLPQPPPFVETPELPPDPLEPSDGTLWYGTVDLFEDEITSNGLILNSLSNNLNIPDKTDADKFILALSPEQARGKDFANLAQKRYGGRKMILRIRQIPDPSLLKFFDDRAEYSGFIPFAGMEIFEIEPETFKGTPEFSI